MKTFKDLDFKKHHNSLYSTQARLDFNNGYGVSVITGYGAYSNESQPYELAIMYNGELCYNTEITDDVIGYLTESEVTDYMIKVQNL